MKVVTMNLTTHGGDLKAVDGPDLHLMEHLLGLGGRILIPVDSNGLLAMDEILTDVKFDVAAQIILRMSL
jgi:hypothetical protein